MIYYSVITVSSSYVQVPALSPHAVINENGHRWSELSSADTSAGF